MTPREYLDQVVRPNRADLDANYSSLRHGLNAIAAVDALAAHMFYALRNAGSTTPPPTQGRRDDDDAYRDHLAQQNNSYDLVREMAKAQKHVEVIYSKKRTAPVPRASSVSMSPLAWGEFPWGRGRFGGADQLVVRTASGAADYVESLLDEAIEFLEAEMTRHGL